MSFLIWNKYALEVSGKCDGEDSEEHFNLTKSWGHTARNAGLEQGGAWCVTRSIFAYGALEGVRAASRRGQGARKRAWPACHTAANTMGKPLQTHQVPYSQTKTSQTNKTKILLLALPQPLPSGCWTKSKFNENKLSLLSPHLSPFLESISHPSAGGKKKISIKTNRRKGETLKNYI